MSRTFDSLLNLTKSFEPSDGKQCNEFGSNIYQPVNGGLSDFNKGVSIMSPYGDYNVSINESVEYNYDPELLLEYIKPVEDYLKSKLKQLNSDEIKRNKSYKNDKDYGSAIGFMQGSDGEPDEDEQEAIKMLNSASHEAQYPPMLSNNIEFESKHEFLNVLNKLYSNLPSDISSELIKNASAIVSKFSIHSYRDYISKVKSVTDDRKFAKESKDQYNSWKEMQVK